MDNILLLGYRSVSRCYLVHQTPPCHIRTFASSPLLTCIVSPCTFHVLLLCEFYSLLICHRDTSVHLFPPPPGCWYTCFFFLAGPDHLHETAVLASSRSPSGHANTSSILFVRSIPRIFLSVFLIPHCFLALAFLLFLPFFCFYLFPTQLPRRHLTLFCFMFLSFRSSSTTLFHLAPAHAFDTFSHTVLPTIAGNILLGKFRTLYITISTVSCLYLSMQLSILISYVRERGRFTQYHV